jgi:CubicO group peptidase (beta-lactamase class C family)
VVPKEWVKASVEKSSSSKDNFYAYQWWHFPDYSSENNNGIVDFYMQGHLGQYVYVNPNNNAIIVRLGTNRGGVYWDGMLNELAATIK